MTRYDVRAELAWAWYRRGERLVLWICCAAIVAMLTGVLG